MRAVNAAYAVLSDPAKRAALDARRYLPRSQTFTATVSTRPRRVPVAVPASPPTALQRRVDRIVVVLGLVLLVAIGFYAVTVILYAERQRQAELRSVPATQPASGGAAAAETAGGQPTTTSAYVPDRLRSDAGLRAFPGFVVVPPARLEPFASLPIMRLDAASQGIARYAVYYGDLTNGGASIAGLIGRANFDAGVPRLADCAPDAAYCAGLAPGQASGPPGLEVFRAPDLVDDSPAFVSHRVCCIGVFWSVSWYSTRANMSYTLDLSRSIAARYGSQTIDGDVSAARAVAALASQLVPLP